MSSSQHHYIGIDVGTGSARACVIDSTGEIKGVASKDIGLWKPEVEFYEQSTTDIWNCICVCVKTAISQGNVDPSSIRGIGLAATCSLAVFDRETNEPIPVTGPDFNNDGNDRNVVLWLDHRAGKETDEINATKHNLLRYVGGGMSIEMEVPKILWLKNNMPAEVFAKCKFFDLTDALTFLATGQEDRSFCSTVCKQGYMPHGVDGSQKGWEEDFFRAIGLDDLVKDDFLRMGGVNGVNGKWASAGEVAGTLSEKAAAQLGLPAGIAVGSGIIDAYAGWVGTVGAKVDLGIVTGAGEDPNDVSQAFSRLAAVAGTSTCHLAMSRDPVFVNGVWGPYRDVLMPEYWMAEGGQSATGELLKHVLETHPAYQDALSQARGSNSNIYEFLNTHLEQLMIKRGAPTISYLGRHFFFYGDLWGNRSPVANPNMAGSVIGLRSDTTIDGLALHYYGAMEFIAMQTRQIISAMNDAGHSLTSIFMSGSQCQNEILMDLVATTCGMPVVIPRYVNAAVVHGAAMLGVKAASTDSVTGATEPLWNIMSRLSKPGHVTMPGKLAQEKALLDAKYDVFLEMVQTQQDYRSKVNKATAGWA